MVSAASKVCSILAVLLALSTSAFAQPTINALRANIGVTGSVCTLHSGTGAPSSGLGAVCDTYLRKDSPYTIYLKTGASTWSDVVTLPGSSGLTTVGALTSGSIASGFGSINVGANSITGGAITGTAISGTTGAFTTSVTTPSLLASANLTISPTGDLITNPGGNDILPGVGYLTNIGSITTKFRELHAAELWIETLVAQNTIATIGGRVLVAPTTTLTSDLTSVATTISVDHNQMASGDRVRMQSNGRLEDMAITSSASGSGPFTYTVTRDLDLTGANSWPAGTAVLNTGTTGNGFIDLYSLWGINSPQFTAVFNFNASGSVYSSNYAETETWSPFADGANDGTNDAIYFGAGATFTNISQWCSSAVGASNATFVWEYWNGSAWTTFTMSSTLAALGRNTATIGTTTGWATTTINGVSAYWVRIRLTNNPSPAMTAASCSLPARAARTWGPTIVGNVRTNTGFNDIAPRWAIGNLSGLYGYSSDTYGAAFGDISTANITVDATNGIRIRDASTNLFHVNTSGDLTIGLPAGNRILWDGTELTIVSGSLTLNASGLAFATPTSSTTTQSYRWDVATGLLGVFGYENSGTDRQVNMASVWTGTGNLSSGVFASMQANHQPSSGGTSHTTSVQAWSSSTVSSVSIAADTTTLEVDGISAAVTFGNDLSIFENNGTTSARPYMTGNGNNLSIESRTAANGGSINVNGTSNANVFLGFGGGSVFLNNARFTGRPLWESGLSQSTVGATGAASAPPANPVGWLQISYNGTNYVVPYYNP